MVISLFSSFSLIKCFSTSTCLVLSWSTGLCEIAIAALLSQKTFMGKGLAVLSFSSNCLIHKTSQIPCATALNSTFALLTLHIPLKLDDLCRPAKPGSRKLLKTIQ